jgi:hypothetical protein
MKSRVGLVLILAINACFSGVFLPQANAAEDEQTAEPAAAKAEKSAADIAREKLQSDLRSVLSSWASAWQSQLDEVYFLHYHPDFKPEGFATLEAWKASRRARVTDPDNISIALKEFELVETHGDTAVVRFWLMYSRPGYADRTRKEMQLRLQGHIWMIEKEHNLAVTRMAPQ